MTSDPNVMLFRIVPAVPGLVVRDPITREPLIADGEVKPMSTYWTRRQADGDVLVAPIEPAQPKSSANNKA
ncbi:DUF2635 domain-containing protein [Paucibacter sp. KBW04]|uniref:DUF2635 domain-containing protein n=1 Tax=Paucibacter sp. KBW04 TaxID=2153361 RepID=UPI001E558F5B|nr:DUF2635 domain-containing protein [Paucibacter sp. KBW04]